MNIASFIASRLAFNKNRAFSRTITRLAITATAISVAVMIMTLGFVNGFQKAVSDKIFSFWGHLRVQHYEHYKSAIAEETAIVKNAEVETELKNTPEVVGIQPFATKYAILKTADFIEGVLFKGVDNTYDFSRMDQFLTQGRWVTFSDSTYSREIVISEYTANQLRLKLNDKVLIYFFRKNDEKPRPDRLTIVGLYKTNMEEYDKLYGIGDLKLVQRLNHWLPDQIGGYEVFLNDYKQLDEVNDDIMEALPLQWGSKTMEDVYPDIFDWLGLQSINRNIVITVMIIIAIINLITCIIIMVLERTRMIGVLKAVGASDWMIQKIFAVQGMYIVLVGTAIGIIAGLGICIFQQKTGWLKFWDEEAYYMTVIPVDIIGWQVAAVVLGTILVCGVIILLPVMISKRIQPAKAVQFK